MERIIKFRAWDGDKMVSPDYIDRLGIAHWKSNSIPKTTDKVMQFTGFNDSMGTGIYEGDILMYISTNQSSMEVMFKDGCFVGEGPFIERPLIEYFNADDFHSVHVTGNIYETIT
jgi:hypothetical protein